MYFAVRVGLNLKKINTLQCLFEGLFFITVGLFAFFSGMSIMGYTSTQPCTNCPGQQVILNLGLFPNSS